MATTDLWTYRDATLRGNALVGYNVEATDGEIGKVDAATDDYIIVDTGTLIFGKKVIVPAGVIERVDLDAEIVYVGRTKDDIKNAPDYDEDRIGEAAYQAELGEYYGRPEQRITGPTQ